MAAWCLLVAIVPPPLTSLLCCFASIGSTFLPYRPGDKLLRIRLLSHSLIYMYTCKICIYRRTHVHTNIYMYVHVYVHVDLCTRTYSPLLPSLFFHFPLSPPFLCSLVSSFLLPPLHPTTSCSHDPPRLRHKATSVTKSSQTT